MSDLWGYRFNHQYLGRRAIGEYELFNPHRGWRHEWARPDRHFGWREHGFGNRGWENRHWDRRGFRDNRFFYTPRMAGYLDNVGMPGIVYYTHMHN